MTIQVAVRFADDELATLDELVSDGVAPTRSDVLRMALAELADRARRRRVAEAIIQSYRDTPPTDEEDAWAAANAHRMVEAEPW